MASTRENVVWVVETISPVFLDFPQFNHLAVASPFRAVPLLGCLKARRVSMPFLDELLPAPFKPAALAWRRRCRDAVAP
jgi:hypothetical protein